METISSSSIRYTLSDFARVQANGFDISLPETTLSIITGLAQEVGNKNYVRTPVFPQKTYIPYEPSTGSTGMGNKTSMARSNHTSLRNTTNHHINDISEDGFTTIKTKSKGKKGNKAIEITNDEDWETIRSFQPTIVKEEKTGFDSQIVLVRSALNKMTESNYDQQSKQIITIFQQLVDNPSCHTLEEIQQIGKALFDIVAGTRFNSKIYANLYTLLIEKFDVMETILQQQFHLFEELFDVIQNVDPEEDYDLFCKFNKENEKRKALSFFYIHLALNGNIEKEKIIELTRSLFQRILCFLDLEGKKMEIDEMIENIAILYKEKQWFRTTEICGELIPALIKRFASAKPKTYKSLTSKSIFKCMEMNNS